MRHLCLFAVATLLVISCKEETTIEETAIIEDVSTVIDENDDDGWETGLEDNSAKIQERSFPLELTDAREGGSKYDYFYAYVTPEEKKTIKRGGALFANRQGHTVNAVRWSKGAYAGTDGDRRVVTLRVHKNNSSSSKGARGVASKVMGCDGNMYVSRKNTFGTGPLADGWCVESEQDFGKGVFFFEYTDADQYKHKIGVVQPEKVNQTILLFGNKGLSISAMPALVATHYLSVTDVTALTNVVSRVTELSLKARYSFKDVLAEKVIVMNIESTIPNPDHPLHLGDVANLPEGYSFDYVVPDTPIPVYRFTDHQSNSLQVSVNGSRVLVSGFGNGSKAYDTPVVSAINEYHDEFFN